MKSLQKDAQERSEIAAITRENIKKILNQKVVTKENTLDFTNKRKLK